MNVDSYKSTDGGHLFNKVQRSARRQPRDVDRSAEYAAHDRLERWRRYGHPGWRQELDAQDNQPTAQFYHVITDIGYALSRVWRAAGSAARSLSPAAVMTARSAAATGMTWAAAKPATSRRIRPIPILFTRRTTRAIITRYDQHIGQVKTITEQPEIIRRAVAPRTWSTASSGRRRS